MSKRVIDIIKVLKMAIIQDTGKDGLFEITLSKEAAQSIENSVKEISTDLLPTKTTDKLYGVKIKIRGDT